MKHCDLINALGGQSAVAREIGVSQPSVHEWTKTGIPSGRIHRMAILAERKGIATRKEICPRDWHLIWPELQDKSNPSSNPLTDERKLP
ncbi:MAG: YdaS family helix-turn-helix protein [Betaproteobacteria bacterium]|nr:YdaS family helix-turn-helix protein [Betaproteobacteria bacterium]